MGLYLLGVICTLVALGFIGKYYGRPKRPILTVLSDPKDKREVKELIKFLKSTIEEHEVNRLIYSHYLSEAEKLLKTFQ